MAKPWRTEIELLQTYRRHKTFTHTTTTDNAEDAVLVGGAMEEGNKICFIVDLNDAYVEFDESATSTSMLIPAGTGYSDDNLYIADKISIKNATAGQNTRIRGIVWGR